MSEKRYEASERKLAWVRMQGYAPVSRAATSLGSIAGAVVAIAFAWRPLLSGRFYELMHESFLQAAAGGSPQPVLADAKWTLLIMLAPSLVGASLGWVLGVGLQTGFAITRPRANRESVGYYVLPCEDSLDLASRWCMGLLLLASAAVTMERIFNELAVTPSAWSQPALAAAACARPVFTVFLPTLVGVVCLDVIVTRRLRLLHSRMSEAEKRREAEDTEPGQITRSRRQLGWKNREIGKHGVR